MVCSDLTRGQARSQFLRVRMERQLAARHRRKKGRVFPLCAVNPSVILITSRRCQQRDQRRTTGEPFLQFLFLVPGGRCEWRLPPCCTDLVRPSMRAYSDPNGHCMAEWARTHFVLRSTIATFRRRRQKGGISGLKILFALLQMRRKRVSRTRTLATAIQSTPLSRSGQVLLVCATKVSS